jgi:uncharacterized membrane-anchored protein
MADNQLIYDLVLETKQAVQATKDLVSKTKVEAGNAGKSAGREFGSQFQNAVNAYIGAISFNAVLGGIMRSVDAFRQVSAANIQLSGAIGFANRSQERNNKIISDSSKSYEQRASQLGISTEEMYENTRATKSNEGAIKSLEKQIRIKERAVEDETRALNQNIRAIENKRDEEIKLIRQQKGYGDLTEEQQKQEEEITNLELKTLQAQKAGNANLFADLSNQLKIKKLDQEITNKKIEQIDNQTDKIKNLYEVQILQLRAELDASKNKFDIDIEPALRKLEDLKASAVSIEGGKVLKKSVKDLVDSYNDNLKKNPPKLIDPKQVDEQIKQLQDKFKVAGKTVIPEASLKQAYGDLIKSGITELPQATALLSDYIEAAASGRSAGVELNTAFTNLAYAFRTNNSQLGNLSGVQENFSDIIADGTIKLKEYYLSIGDIGSAGRVDQGILTDQEKLQAKILGTDKAVADTRGSWDRLAESGALSSAIIENETLKLEQAIGKILSPTVTEATVQLAEFVSKIILFIKENPQMVLALSGLALGFTGIVSIISGIMAIMPALTFAFGLIATPIGIVAVGIAGLVVVMYNLVKGIQWAYDNVGWFRDLVDKAFKKIIETVNWAKDNWLQALGAILGFFISLPFKLPMYIQQAFNAVIGYIQSINWGVILGGMLRAFYDITDAMGRALSNIFSGENLRRAGNGFMDFIRGLLDGIASGIPGADAIIKPLKDSLPRFATGGEFMVGGRGGVDKNLVQFMATKGEKVIVQTPTQQNSSVNSGNTVTNNYINYGGTNSNFAPAFMTSFA